MPASALGMNTLDDSKQWLMTSAENDTLGTQPFKKGASYESYKVKIDNAHNNTISILSNNFVMPPGQADTIQQYTHQPLQTKKKN